MTTAENVQLREQEERAVLNRVYSWQEEHEFKIATTDHLVTMFQNDPDLLIRFGRNGIPVDGPRQLLELSFLAGRLERLVLNPAFDLQKHVEGEINKSWVAFENFRLLFESTPADEVRLMLQGMQTRLRKHRA